MTAVIPIEAIAGASVMSPTLRSRADSTLRMRRVVEEIHVEISVTVIIEEHGLRRISRESESVFFGLVGERPIAIVDVEDVVAVHVQIRDAADKNVQAAVSVDVGHRHAALPSVWISDTGF